MKRGDIVTVVLTGDIGKPRPALIIQSDLFRPTGIVVLPLSSTLAEASLARLTIDPTALNGLRSPSQIMIDKVTTLRREKVGRIIGQIDNDTLAELNRAITLFFGIA